MIHEPPLMGTLTNAPGADEQVASAIRYFETIVSLLEAEKIEDGRACLSKRSHSVLALGTRCRGW